MSGSNFLACFARRYIRLLFKMRFRTIFMAKIGFTFLVPNSNFDRNFSKVHKYFRTSNRVVVEYTHQTFFNNLQKPVCRYLLKRLRSKHLTIMAFLKKLPILSQNSNFGYGPAFYGGYEMNIPNPGHPQYFYGEVRPELPSNSFLPQDCSDCVFISNLPLTVQKDQIADLFSRAGKIRTSKGLFNCTTFRARFIFSRLFHRFGSFLEEIFYITIRAFTYQFDVFRGLSYRNHLQL